MKTILAGALAALLAPATALACGGTFCDGGPGPAAPQQIQQNGERILFTHGSDGRMVAVIQIAYEGPADEFSWILPVRGTPEVAAATDAVFDALDGVTAPVVSQDFWSYDDCEYPNDGFSGCGMGADTGFAASAAGDWVEVPPDPPGYRPLGEGSTGPYDWVILPGTSADEVIGWLNRNAYYAPAGAAGLLKPYVDGEHNFVALRLRSGFTSGQIVPVVVTSDEPDACVPLRLTAVAATEDMPVLVWILGDARATPSNFTAVDLNYARLDFANGGSNYDDLIREAVDAAPGGMGFVTQFAGPTPGMRGRVYPPPVDAGAEVNATLQELQALLDGKPYLTRIYTRISPGEMLDDPVFVENPDLPPVSRELVQQVHVVCEGKPASESPVRVDNPDGTHLWFRSQADVKLPLTTGPAARYVLKTGRQGAGVVITDNATAIDAGFADPRGCGGCQASGRGAAWLVAVGVLLAWRRVRGRG